MISYNKLSNSIGVLAMAKKWSPSHRVWHWCNALVVFTLILTGLFIKIGNPVEDYFKKPHILVGLTLCVLVPFRMIRARFFGDRHTLDDAQKLRTQAISLFKQKKGSLTRADFKLFHKASVKNGYLGLYALLAGIALTGLAMIIMHQMGISKEIRHNVKEVHEALFVLIAVFIPLHLGGVVYAEITDEPNIISDMIHGGKK